MSKLWTWLQGKKTYIAAGLLLLLAIFSFWFGVLGPVQTTALVIIAFGLFGLGDKSDRYGKLLVQYLESAKKLDDERKRKAQLAGK